MSSDPQKITFRFKKDDDYRIVPANSVWGEVTPRNDILVDFIHESVGLPDVVTHAVKPDGKLGDELERNPLGQVQRTAMVGIVLSAGQAESIANWLHEKARESRERREVHDRQRDTATTH